MPCLYEIGGRHAKLLRNRNEVRLMRFEEAQQCHEQNWIVRACPQLASPDSGQFDEPLRPPLITKRCGKRTKRERRGVPRRVIPVFTKQGYTAVGAERGIRWPRS